MSDSVSKPVRGLVRVRGENTNLHDPHHRRFDYKNIYTFIHGARVEQWSEAPCNTNVGREVEVKNDSLCMLLGTAVQGARMTFAFAGLEKRELSMLHLHSVSSE